MTTRFQNRSEAGRRLVEQLLAYSGRSDVVVLALPPGGVPVGIEIARKIHAPLDVFVVRKLGVPGCKELAMGVISSGGIRVLNEDVVHALKTPERVIAAVTERARRDLTVSEHAYRGDRPLAEIHGRSVILVDDGIATGCTMLAAIRALRQLAPAQIVVAVPAAAQSTREEIGREVDDFICEITPSPFYAVGVWYDDYSRMTDEEVRETLNQSVAEPSFA